MSSAFGSGQNAFSWSISPKVPFRGSSTAGSPPTARSRWPCWKTARTSITESGSAPAGVYRAIGDFSAARNSHSARARDAPPAGRRSAKT